MPWIVAQTRSGDERPVSDMLCGRGFETYLPMASVTRNHSRKIVQVTTPLFPRYLFVRDCSARNLIRRTMRVQDVLMAGDRFSLMSDSDVTAIRSREGHDGLIVIDDSNPTRHMSAGDRVRISSGPYAGISAVFVCRSGDERAEIMIRMLGCERRARIDIDALEAA